MQTTTTAAAPTASTPLVLPPAVHAQLAAVVRHVISVDLAGAEELTKAGMTPDADTMRLTRAMQEALAAYNFATEMSQQARIPAMLEIALKRLADGKTDEAATFITSARMALDYLPFPTVEEIARTLCEADGLKPDERTVATGDGVDPRSTWCANWEIYEHSAKAVRALCCPPWALDEPKPAPADPA